MRTYLQDYLAILAEMLRPLTGSDEDPLLGREGASMQVVATPHRER